MTTTQKSWRATWAVLLFALVAASTAGTLLYFAVEAIFGSTSGLVAASGAYAAVLTTICATELPAGRRLASVLSLLAVTGSLLVIAVYVMMLIFISGYT